MAKKRKQTGLPPGSIVFTGEQKTDRPEIIFVRYNADQIEERKVSYQEKLPYIESPTRSHIEWYDVRGLHDTKLIEAIGKTFKIHPLFLEDVADTQQRPKFEELGQNLFLTLRSLTFDTLHHKCQTQQISIVIGPGYLVTFQEDADDLFANVRNRLHASRGRVRGRGSDYLAYALIDDIVDHYFVLLDRIEDEIDRIEESILTDPSESSKSQIHQLKRETLVARKSVAPLREAISRFSKSESELIDEKTQPFVRDLYDHTIQIMDSVDTFRDILNGLQDLYLSEISFKMNNVMQVLTIISTIFIPLTFLAGIYGMNFEYIPELKWKYSYFFFWGVMITITIMLVFFFRRKKWL